VFPGASGFGLWDVVNVQGNFNDGVIHSVTANGMTLTGLSLDLRNAELQVEATAGTWTNGRWFASLVIQSQGADLMRVCWNVHLPPPPPVTGPPGFEPVVREADFKRLMCGIYSRTETGRDRGGYMVDDYAGQVTTYTGRW
jgi:hypothetical protein